MTMKQHRPTKPSGFETEGRNTNLFGGGGADMDMASNADWMGVSGYAQLAGNAATAALLSDKLASTSSGSLQAEDKTRVLDNVDQTVSSFGEAGVSAETGPMGGTIYVQVGRGDDGRPLIPETKQKEIHALFDKICKDYDIDLSIVFSNDRKLMSRNAFTSREDYNPQDTYMVIGDNDWGNDLNEGKRAKGWEGYRGSGHFGGQRDNLDTPENEAEGKIIGKAPEELDMNFAYYSIEAHHNKPRTSAKAREAAAKESPTDPNRALTFVEELTWGIMHEVSHLKLRYDWTNRGETELYTNYNQDPDGGVQETMVGGHSTGTFMGDGGASRLENARMSDYQARVLRSMHGSQSKSGKGAGDDYGKPIELTVPFVKWFRNSSDIEDYRGASLRRMWDQEVYPKLPTWARDVVAARHANKTLSNREDVPDEYQLISEGGAAAEAMLPEEYRGSYSKKTSTGGGTAGWINF
jgi:hypothetical protein